MSSGALEHSAKKYVMRCSWHILPSCSIATCVLGWRAMLFAHGKSLLALLTLSLLTLYFISARVSACQLMGRTLDKRCRFLMTCSLSRTIANGNRDTL